MNYDIKDVSLSQRANEIFKRLHEASPKEIQFIEQKDPFRLLVCVILSAQTTDNQVNKVSDALFGKYPTPEKLANASFDDVKEIIKSTGYYSVKASYIIETAKSIHEKFSDTVPLTMEELTSLSGVGRKTANVVLGHIGNMPAIIVDTHFLRVVRRIGLTDKTQTHIIEREVSTLLPPEHHYRFSMIINLHGRTTCKAKKPDCSSCIIKDVCISYPIQ